MYRYQYLRKSSGGQRVVTSITLTCRGHRQRCNELQLNTVTTVATVICKLLVEEANDTAPVQTVNSAYILLLKE